MGLNLGGGGMDLFFTTFGLLSVSLVTVDVEEKDPWELVSLSLELYLLFLDLFNLLAMAVMASWKDEEEDELVLLEISVPDELLDSKVQTLT